MTGYGIDQSGLERNKIIICRTVQNINKTFDCSQIFVRFEEEKQKQIEKIFLPTFLIFVYYEIQSNHFQKLIEVLVIYAFQIRHIVLIFVSINTRKIIILLNEKEKKDICLFVFT